MGLSDEVLKRRSALRELRRLLSSLVSETGASAAFLVDEEGTPFATVGHIEFELPHPLAGLVTDGSSDALLGALLGESPEPTEGFLVERAGPRALVVLVHSDAARAQRERLAAAAADLSALL